MTAFIVFTRDIVCLIDVLCCASVVFRDVEHAWCTSEASRWHLDVLTSHVYFAFALLKRVDSLSAALENGNSFSSTRRYPGAAQRNAKSLKARRRSFSPCFNRRFLIGGCPRVIYSKQTDSVCYLKTLHFTKDYTAEAFTVSAYRNSNSLLKHFARCYSVKKVVTRHALLLFLTYR